MTFVLIFQNRSEICYQGAVAIGIVFCFWFLFFCGNIVVQQHNRICVANVYCGVVTIL